MTFTSKDMPRQDPNPFCESLPYQLLFWNNSSWQIAAHCPRHYWYTTVRGLAPRGDAGSVHLTFGTIVHAAADVYSKAVAAGADTELATEFALDYALKASWPEDAAEDVFGGRYGEVWQCTDRTRTNSKKGIQRCPWSKAEHLVSALPWDATRKPGRGENPTMGPDPMDPTHIMCVCGHSAAPRIAYLCPEKVKNRRTLARTVVALCDRMSAGSVKPRVLPDGRIGSEYRWFRQLSIGVEAPNFRFYNMTGSFDGVASAPGVTTVIPEYKSTQREPNPSFWAGYEMSPQVHTYTWAGQGEFGPGTRVMLFALHIGVGFTEIYPKTVYLSPAALAEWEGELAHKIQEFELRARLAQQHEAAGQDPAIAYPRNLAGCNSLPGAPTTPCPFRDYCRLSPGDREGFIQANFEVAPHNPLGVAGTSIGETSDA